MDEEDADTAQEDDIETDEIDGARPSLRTRPLCDRFHGAVSG